MGARILALLGLMLSAAAAAQADQTFFHSPSGNIQCELDFDVGPGIPNAAYCQTFEPAQSVTLKPNGKFKTCEGTQCLGDGPQDAKTLRFGKHVTQGPFRCDSARNGITCIVMKIGKGFRISRAGTKRIAGHVNP